MSKLQHIKKLLENTAAIERWSNWLTNEQESARESLHNFIKGKMGIREC